MQGRYDADDNARQTDEFMKPIILNSEGLIKGIGFHGLQHSNNLDVFRW